MRSNNFLIGILCVLPLVPALVFPGIGVLGSLAIVLLVLFLVKDSRRATLAFSTDGMVRPALVGLLFGLAVAVAFDAVIEPLVEKATGQEIALEGLGEIEGNLVSYLLLLAIGLLFGGVAEELIFRGFVVGWGTRVFGERAAVWLVLLSATVFGLSHLYQSVAGVIATGLIGMLFGLLYLWAGRKLMPPMIAHMTVNAYGITLLYLGIGG